MGKVV